MAFVYAGGFAAATTVNSTGFGALNGGLVLSGGTASGTVLNSGGEEGVWAGGTDISGTIAHSGGLFVFTGGLASGTVVDNAAFGFSAGGLIWRMCRS